MGNLTSNLSNSQGNNENKNNEIKGDSSAVELEENGARRHRYSVGDPKKDKQIRNDYLMKINQGIQKENEEKFSMRNKTFIDPFSEYENISSSFIGDFNGKLLFLTIANESAIFDDSPSVKNGTRVDKLRERGKLTSFYKRQKEKKDEQSRSRCMSTENFKNSFTIAKDTLMIDFDENNADVLDIDGNKQHIDITTKRSFGVHRKGHSDINPELISNDDLCIDDARSLVSKSTITKTNPQCEYEMIYLKSAENLRRAYIAKLIYKNVWQPTKIEKDHNTLIIFDWDDTLLCTSFLTPNGVFNEDIELSDKEHEKIAKLEFAVLRLLTLAIQKGDTYIITNAAPGWVEYSVERFYPSVKQLLEKVTIVSARGDYESMYPGDSRMWKIQAFLKMQKQHDPNLVTNLICLGDSFIEMEAAHVLASKFQQAFIKTIKFRESPKPEELVKQLLLVADQFSTIFSVVKNLTIRVEKKIK
jgi:hypothetical protein